MQVRQKVGGYNYVRGKCINVWVYWRKEIQFEVRCSMFKVVLFRAHDSGTKNNSIKKVANSYKISNPDSLFVKRRL